MIKYLELALSQEVYEYLEELDQMNWSARGNVLNQYLSNTSIGTTVRGEYTLNLMFATSCNVIVSALIIDRLFQFQHACKNMLCSFSTCL